MDINPITGVRTDSLANPRKTGGIVAPKFDVNATTDEGHDKGEENSSRRQPPQLKVAADDPELDGELPVDPIDGLPAKGTNFDGVA